MKHTVFDLIVWDWDGTIADSTGIITQALITAAEEADLPALSEARARSIIGLGLRESIAALYGEIPEAQSQTLIMAYNHHFRAAQEQIVLFDGVASLIAAIHERGCAQAVATGKGRRGLNSALQSSGLERYFGATKTVDECFSKPHPQMLEELLDTFLVLPERCLMIGDSLYDMQMGKNAGVTTLAVSYGSQSAAALMQATPDMICHDVASVAGWLLEQV